MEEESLTRTEIVQMHENLQTEMQSFIVKQIDLLRADIAELTNLNKNIKIGVGIFSASGEFLSKVGKAALGIGSVILFLKYGVTWLIHWATNK